MKVEVMISEHTETNRFNVWIKKDDKMITLILNTPEMRYLIGKFDNAI